MAAGCIKRLFYEGKNCMKAPAARYPDAKSKG